MSRAADPAPDAAATPGHDDVGPGPRVLVVQHQEDCPPALVGHWLEEAGAALDVRHPYRGDDLPADLAGHDALLVLGGSMGADDDAEHAWLAPTKQLVRTAAGAGTPVLGVCLGHQLVGRALGGRVDRNPRGQQVGLVETGWTAAAADDALVGAVAPGARRGVHWNDDLVVELPPGAVVLAETPAGEAQVVRHAPGAWGVQLHPEVDAAVVRAWAVGDAERHAAGGVDQAAVIAAVDAARAELDAAWRPLAQAFARVAAGDLEAARQR